MTEPVGTLIALDQAKPGIPRHVAPMRPRLAAEPFNSADHLFEVKWDGIRALLGRDARGVHVVDAKGGDLLPVVPELREASVPEGALLDGEIVVCDSRGRPAYDLLAGRIGPRRARRGRGPLFVAFDLLYQGGRPLLARPLEERRRALLGLGIGDRRVAVPEHLEHDGEPFFDVVAEYDLEGIVAKRRRSPYVPGARTSDWLKCHVTPRADVVMGGLAIDETRGARSVLCGWWTDDGLAYAGEAYVPAYLRQWLDEATRDLAADTSPFSAVLPVRAGWRWLRPTLVAIVEHGGDPTGLHDARFRAIRLDGDPHSAICEQPTAIASAAPSGPVDRPRLVVLRSLFPPSAER